MAVAVEVLPELPPLVAAATPAATPAATATPAAMIPIVLMLKPAAPVAPAAPAAPAPVPAPVVVPAPPPAAWACANGDSIIVNTIDVATKSLIFIMTLAFGEETNPVGGERYQERNKVSKFLGNNEIHTAVMELQVAQDFPQHKRFT